MIRPAGNSRLNNSWKKEISPFYELFVHSHTYCIFICWSAVYLSFCSARLLRLLWLFCYLVATSVKYIWKHLIHPHLPPLPLSYNSFNYVVLSWFLAGIILFQSTHCATCGSWIKFTNQVDPNFDLHLIKYRIKPKNPVTQLSGLNGNTDELSDLTWPFKTKGTSWVSLLLSKREMLSFSLKCGPCWTEMEPDSFIQSDLFGLQSQISPKFAGQLFWGGPFSHRLENCHKEAIETNSNIHKYCRIWIV